MSKSFRCTIFDDSRSYMQNDRTQTRKAITGSYFIKTFFTILLLYSLARARDDAQFMSFYSSQSLMSFGSTAIINRELASWTSYVD